MRNVIALVAAALMLPDTGGLNIKVMPTGVMEAMDTIATMAADTVMIAGIAEDAATGVADRTDGKEEEAVIARTDTARIMATTSKDIISKDITKMEAIANIMGRAIRITMVVAVAVGDNNGIYRRQIKGAA